MKKDTLCCKQTATAHEKRRQGTTISQQHQNNFTRRPPHEQSLHSTPCMWCTVHHAACSLCTRHVCTCTTAQCTVHTRHGSLLLARRCCLLLSDVQQFWFLCLLLCGVVFGVVVSDIFSGARRDCAFQGFSRYTNTGTQTTHTRNVTDVESV